MKINQPEKAFQAFNDACTKADFDNVHGYDAYGKISIMLKKYDDALFAYTKMLAVDPSSLTARYQIATIYYLTKQYDKAGKTYRELLQFEPNNLILHFQLGETLAAERKYAEALEHYHTVQRLQPTYAPLYCSLADALAKSGQVGQARTMLKDFIVQNPPQEVNQRAEKLLAQMQ
jgi:predicted Zn-dependent protease